jgi:hypothetical protein
MGTGDLTKAIRFSKEEWQLIKDFLEQNPFFDFSSLARTAIREFVRDPKLVIRGVKDRAKASERSRRSPEVEGV